eukprot:1207311-Prymnesium_polylepis.1
MGRRTGGAAATIAGGNGSHRVILGRTLGKLKEEPGGFRFFVDSRSSADLLTSAAKAFDMHIYVYWLRRSSRAHPRGGDVVEWLARFHARACNVSRSAFDRLPWKPYSGAAKYEFL